MGLFRRPDFYSIVVTGGMVDVRFGRLLAIVAAAQHDQSDKVGVPILLHVIRVAQRAVLLVDKPLVERGQDGELVVGAVLAAALLHDAWEDERLLVSKVDSSLFPWSVQSRNAVTYGLGPKPERRIESSLTDDEHEALDRLAHAPHEPYDRYISRVSGNYIATIVKIADLQDNLERRRLRFIDKDTRWRLEAKYVPALSFLKRALAEHRTYALHHAVASKWADGK